MKRISDDLSRLFDMPVPHTHFGEDNEENYLWEDITEWVRGGQNFARGGSGGGRHMVSILMENIAPGLSGELTQWMLEVKAGVLVGNDSASIRDILWDMVCRQAGAASALLLYSADTE